MDTLESLYRSAAAVRAAGMSPEESRAYYARYVEFVAAFAPPGGRVLDVGCGNGWSTHWLAERGFSAVGVDLNPAAFEPPARDRLALAEGSALALPCPDGAFDAVAAYQCLEHVPDPGRALSEMLRVTRPGGVVCVAGPNLLSLGMSFRAVTDYVWRNRPLRRIFFRTRDMPRHPFGNTFPETIYFLVRNAALILTKWLSRRSHFTFRTPDLRPPFHADNDATWLCNPLDVSRFFRARGCVILADVPPGRWSWSRIIAGGTWVAARKDD